MGPLHLFTEIIQTLLFATEAGIGYLQALRTIFVTQAAVLRDSDSQRDGADVGPRLLHFRMGASATAPLVRRTTGDCLERGDYCVAAAAR